MLCMLLYTVHFHTSRIPIIDRAPSSTPVHYHSVECDGSESGITGCPRSSDVNLYLISPNNYNHIFDVFIVCQPSSSAYSGMCIVALMVYLLIIMTTMLQIFIAVIPHTGTFCIVAPMP